MQTLVESLKNGTVEVTFEKRDGTVRVMRATTKPEMISYVPVGGAPNRERMDLITAWDLDINQWRAFKESRVISWKAVA